MKTLIITAAALGLAGTLTAGAVAADRAPTQQEQASIEKALKAAGYVSWEEIELDDDGPYWDIDDARKSDKTRWDVKLAEGSYEILSQEAD